MANCQQFEVGFGIGATNYKGDVAPTVSYKNTQPAGLIFGRMNFSHAVSLKTSLLVGKISGNDANSNDPFLQTRNYGFNSLIAEGSAVVEYNFFDFRSDDRRLKFSPFIFGGAGITFFLTHETTGNAPNNTSQTILPVVPFGVGIKHVLNDRLTLEYFFSTSKNFSDNTDGFIENIEDPSTNKFQKISRKDIENYYFLGFSLSYRFIQVNCPKHFNNSLIH